MQFTLVIEKTIAVERGKNIYATKGFNLPFVPYIGLRILKDGYEYTISEKLIYLADYDAFSDPQYENVFYENTTIDDYIKQIKPMWDRAEIEIVKY